MLKIHYSPSPDINPMCYKCGHRINPGLDHEPYTTSISIWINPPKPFHRCVEIYIDDRPSN